MAKLPKLGLTYRRTECTDENGFRQYYQAEATVVRVDEKFGVVVYDYATELSAGARYRKEMLHHFVRDWNV